jgi:DNA-damage-inducible protein D
MKTERVHSLIETFEGYAKQTETDVEYELARDLQHLLDYTKWENFLNVVVKAKTACEVSDHAVENHFPDVRKIVDLGSDSRREITKRTLTSCVHVPIRYNPPIRPLAVSPLDHPESAPNPWGFRVSVVSRRRA